MVKRTLALAVLVTLALSGCMSGQSPTADELHDWHQRQAAVQATIDGCAVVGKPGVVRSENGVRFAVDPTGAQGISTTDATCLLSGVGVTGAAELLTSHTAAGRPSANPLMDVSWNTDRNGAKTFTIDMFLLS